jgi:hypothetical protein
MSRSRKVAESAAVLADQLICEGVICAYDMLRVRVRAVIRVLEQRFEGGADLHVFQELLRCLGRQARRFDARPGGHCQLVAA